VRSTSAHPPAELTLLPPARSFLRQVRVRLVLSIFRAARARPDSTSCAQLREQGLRDGQVPPLSDLAHLSRVLLSLSRSAQRRAHVSLSPAAAQTLSYPLVYLALQRRSSSTPRASTRPRARRRSSPRRRSGAPSSRASSSFLLPLPPSASAGRLARRRRARRQRCRGRRGGARCARRRGACRRG